MLSKMLFVNYKASTKSSRNLVHGVPCHDELLSAASATRCLRTKLAPSWHGATDANGCHFACEGNGRALYLVPYLNVVFEELDQIEFPFYAQFRWAQAPLQQSKERGKVSTTQNVTFP